MKQDKKNKRRNKRFSIRRKIFGTNSTPRLAIFRSNREIYVQIIDDTKGNTLVAASSKDTSLEKKKLTKIETQVKKRILDPFTGANIMLNK